MTPRIPKMLTVMMMAGFLAAAPGCGWKEGVSHPESGQEKLQTLEATEPEQAVPPEDDINSVDPAPFSAADEPTADQTEGRLLQEEYAGVPEPPETELPIPGKIAYLTFDDGPSGHTDTILDILKQYGVKATFFVIGRESEKSIASYRRISEEGHKLGNHTYSHDYTKLYRNPDVFMKDVRKLENFLRETAGQKTDILRFPGGSNTRLGRRKGQAWLMPQLVKRVKEEGYQYFDWNVSSTDAAQAVQPKVDIVASVLSAAKDKEQIIVLMHDAKAKTTTVEALPEVIRGLKRMGYRFGTLTKDSFATQFLQ